MILYKYNLNGEYVVATESEIRETHIENDNLIDAFWCIDDIKWCAFNNNLILDDDQINNIASSIEHNHDANIGINWDNISCHIDMYCDDNKIEKEEIS